MNKELKYDRSVQLPLSGGLISIDFTGTVRDYKSNIIQSYKNSNNEFVVKLSWIDGYKEYEISRLMALTFKPLRIPINYWFSIELLFIDDNKLNIQVNNLIWKFPNKGIESKKYPGFYFIPNFTRYLISKDGVVINLLSGLVLEGNTRSKGYIYYCLKSDTGQTTTIGKHRLLALTFLKFTKISDKLDVNHIDGCPGNNNINNLEWSTRSSNMLHAYANNLRDDNKTVIVTNHNTGEEIEYFSAHECERQLGLSRSVVHYRIKVGGVFPPGYSFKYKNTNNIINLTRQYGTPVSIKNLNTGEIKRFPSIIQCSKYLNISKKVIQKRLKNNSSIIYKNYEISK